MRRGQYIVIFNIDSVSVLLSLLLLLLLPGGVCASVCLPVTCARLLLPSSFYVVPAPCIPFASLHWVCAVWFWTLNTDTCYISESLTMPYVMLNCIDT